MNDSHLSRLSGLKGKLKDLGSNLGDSVICSHFKCFVSSGARWDTRRVCGHLCMANDRYSLPALSLVAALCENMEPGSLPVAGTQCTLTLACCFPWQWLASVPLLCLG